VGHGPRFRGWPEAQQVAEDRRGEHAGDVHQGDDGAEGEPEGQVEHRDDGMFDRSQREQTFRSSVSGMSVEAQNRFIAPRYINEVGGRRNDRSATTGCG
jgi:hypothetical protein